MSADQRAEHIRREVTGWPGVTTAPGEYGETDFVLDGRSIGHIHGGHQADIPFPRRVRDELVAAGRTGPHHVHPDSGWTTLYIRTDADADEAIELLRINYDRITQRAATSSGG
jgi:Luciferase